MRALLVVLTVLCLAGTAEAQQSELVTHNGVVGMWFPMPVAERLLSDVEELRSLRLQVGLLNQQLAFKAETVDLLRHSLTLTEQQAVEWRHALQEALARPADRPSLWNSKEFWFFTGFAASAVLAVGLSFGLSSSH